MNGKVAASSLWLLFVGLGALIPLYFKAAPTAVAMFDFDLISGGDLLMIAIVVIAASIGELAYLFVRRGTGGVLGVAILVAQFVVVVCSIQKYITATSPVPIDEGKSYAPYGELHPASVAHGSFLMFGLAVLLGWGTLMLRSAAEETAASTVKEEA